MSTIAWDGATLAADRQATQVGCRRACSKIWRCERTGELLGTVGQTDTSEAARRWYEEGADPDKFPAANRNDNTMSCLYVVRRDRTCVKYETEPFALTIEEDFWAAGSGRDYALGALMANVTAYRAVEIACAFDVNSGMGVETLELE